MTEKERSPFCQQIEKSLLSLLARGYVGLKHFKEKLFKKSLLEKLITAERFLENKKLTLVKDFSSFSPKEISLLAHQASELIRQRSEGHMFTPEPNELEKSFNDNQCLAIVNEEGKLVGFVRMLPWELDGQVKVWELGSLVVDSGLTGNHLGLLLVVEMLKKHFSFQENEKNPLIAVVTQDNKPSLKVFSNLPFFDRLPVDRLNSKDFTKLEINGVNVLDGWGIPSEVFLLNLNQFKNFLFNYNSQYGKYKKSN